SFAPDGRVMAAGDWKGMIRFYEVGSWKVLDEIQTQVGPTVWSIAFSPKGQYFAAAGSKGLMLWRVVSAGAEQLVGKPLSLEFLGSLSEAFCSSICFSSDGNWLAGVKVILNVPNSAPVHVWDLRNWQTDALPAARCRYDILALSSFPDNNHLAFVSDK